MRYHGREMECLSIMLKEGDSWLERLAEVLEGGTDSDGGGDGGGADAAEEEAQAAAATTADSSRRTSSRAGRGTRKRSRDDDADDGGGARTASKVSAVWYNPVRSASCCFFVTLLAVCIGFPCCLLFVVFCCWVGCVWLARMMSGACFTSFSPPQRTHRTSSTWVLHARGPGARGFFTPKEKKYM